MSVCRVSLQCFRHCGERHYGIGGFDVYSRQEALAGRLSLLQCQQDIAKELPERESKETNIKTPPSIHLAHHLSGLLMFKSAVYSLSITHGRFNKRVNTFVTIIKRTDFDHYIG